jgi:MFS family permease
MLRSQRSFVLYWFARTSTNGAFHMQAVAVGWQIYALTGSAFDLGLVGLVQFFPVVVLGIAVGQIADRYDRRRVVAICQVMKALAAAAFAVGSLGGWLSREAMLAILFLSATARAFEIPTMHAMVPVIVPPALLQRAIAAARARAAGRLQGAALRRLRAGAPAHAGRKALRAAAARPVLGGAGAAHLAASMAA